MEKLDIPQGTLDLMILTILAREPMHGYGISQRLAVLSHDQFQRQSGIALPVALPPGAGRQAEGRMAGDREQPAREVLPPHGRRQAAARAASRAMESRLVRRRQCAGGRMTLLHRLASIVRWMVRRNRAERRPGRRTADVRRHGRRRPGPRRRDARPRRAAWRCFSSAAWSRRRSACEPAAMARWLDAAGRDVRYGLRQVRRNPAFSAIAIATLALGIGGITAMFSAFDAVLIRPLPYADADRLVMIWDDMGQDRRRPRTQSPRRRNGSSGGVSIPSSRISRAASRATRRSPATASLNRFRRERSPGPSGACLACGRCLDASSPRTRTTQGVRVVVISHGLWQRRFGGASDIVGRKISLNDEPYEVVGVMPRNFYFMPSREIDLWMPASFPPWMRQQLQLARRADRRAAQARRHAGAGARRPWRR